MRVSRHIWTRLGLQEISIKVLGKTACIYPASKLRVVTLGP